MAFPQLITSGSVTAQANGVLGPFLIGSALYVQLLNSSTDAPQIWKSTDLTNGTTWAQVGSDGATPTQASYLSIAVGSDIYVFNWNSGSDLLVQIFNTSTNTWGSVIDTGIVAADGQNAGAAYRSSDNTIILMADVVSFFSGSKARCAYTVYNISSQTASAWTACGQTSGSDANYWLPIYNPVVRGSGRTHFFFASIDITETTNSFLVQQSLEDSGTLESFATIDTESAIDNTSNQLQWNANSDGSTVVVQWQPYSTPGNVLVFTGSSASTISFSSQTVSLSSPNAWSVTRGSDSNTYFVVSDSVSGNVLAYVDSGGGFGSPNNMGAFTAFHMAAFLYSGSQPAFMYLEGSQWFNFIVFSTPPTQTISPNTIGTGENWPTPSVIAVGNSYAYSS